jgi:hypothetical protein
VCVNVNASLSKQWKKNWHSAKKLPNVKKENFWK